MGIYVDATTLIALGGVGSLDLRTVFDRWILVPHGVRAEVSGEPAKSTLERKLSTECEFFEAGIAGEHVDRAREILDESKETGDTWIIAAVISRRASDEEVAVISDDRRVRTVARGLGATVAGPIGVVVRNVADGELTADEAKDLVRRLDSHGLHMTGELREKADELIDEAAEDAEE